MKNLRYYVPGALVILAGLLILAVPEILLAIVVALIILIGVLGLYIGHRIRQADRDLEDDYDSGWRFSRVPRGRRRDWDF
jgi:xanthosine utilization system XapX-like protein